MDTIQKGELSRVFGAVSCSQIRSVSPDAESKKMGISKQLEVEVSFEGATLEAVLKGAYRTAVISWANGIGRKGFEKLGSKVTVKFTAPSQRTMSKEEVLRQGIVEYKTMTPEAKAAYRKQLEEADKE